LSPTSHDELAELAGTVLGVEITTFDLTVYLDITSGTEARLLTHCELPTAAFVRGTVEDFASLASSKDPAAVLINSGIELEGNSASLIALQQVISRMDIDWEAPLVDTLGDVMGHQIAEALRRIFRWGEGAHASLRRQVSEFVLEEARLTPPKAELEYFFDAVQSLSMQVDRVQSKFEKLRAKVEQKRGQA
jgi:ubiquinone biosynthesis protein UbiJ